MKREEKLKEALRELVDAVFNTEFNVTDELDCAMNNAKAILEQSTTQPILSVDELKVLKHFKNNNDVIYPESDYDKRESTNQPPQSASELYNEFEKVLRSTDANEAIIKHLVKFAKAYANQQKQVRLFGEWIDKIENEFEMWVVKKHFAITGSNTERLWGMFINQQKEVSDEEIERLINLVVKITSTSESDKQFQLSETIKEWILYNELTK